MNLHEQLKHNTEEYIRNKHTNKNLRLTIRVKKVETKKLTKDLLTLRQSFAPWDDERRRKVDLVLSALDEKEKYTDLEEAEARLNELSEDDELLPAARKMLRLHHSELSMTVKERFNMRRRLYRAQKKLNKWRQH